MNDHTHQYHEETVTNARGGDKKTYPLRKCMVPGCGRKWIQMDGAWCELEVTQAGPVVYPTRSE